MLVCFAVPQEARPFRKRLGQQAGVRILITGMGRENAERSIRATLNAARPARVLTCGFAGALREDLQIGDVICATETPLPGARPVRIFCHDRVAVSVEEKAALRQRTGADAVEMESGFIEGICRESGVPCATLRVISDTAQESLPLDFNALLTQAKELDALKLALAVLKAPQKIPALMRLGKNSALAAERLADALGAALAR